LKALFYTVPDINVETSILDAIEPPIASVFGINTTRLPAAFGQAQLGGRAALVSVARLRQPFYGLPPNTWLLCDRASTTALHELGHTFGLVHCRNTSCVMSLSADVVQVDAKQCAFCRSCTILLNESKGMADLRRARSKGEM